ncbi:recombinase family protein [Streptomyces sp. NBC_01207]|uniref:recombinase family protein n=1 Tax=Streptomyces sp. NBC_01207 TaxID=2903772 RepID=UPI002E12A534|nr:recombinase family protein [Streptomyces sp. NBC_01207]
MTATTINRTTGTLSVPTKGMNTDATDTRPWLDLLLRKSKIVREGERALSIRAQEDRGRAWADENGYRVRRVWTENLSAWSDVKRPKYDAALIALGDSDGPDALWCYAMDRFSRKGAESVVPILGRKRVIFDYERLDSMDERDRRWIIDRAENAREYSQRLSYNVRTTKAKQLKEGRWLSKAPFGLTADPDTRKLSPDHSPYLCVVSDRREVTPWEVVSRIFQEISNGVPARRLARILNSEGLRTVSGADWVAATICRIVRHPVYEGWLTHRIGEKSSVAEIAVYRDAAGKPVRVVEPDVVKHMIPAKTAARARRVLQGNQAIAFPAKPETQEAAVESVGQLVHALSGKLRCAGCDYGMTLGGKSYNCNRKTHGGICPDPASVNRLAIERYVVDVWSDRLHRAVDGDPLMIAVAERWQALTHPEESQEIADARAEIKAAQAALDKFHADDAAGFYSGRSAKYRIPTKNAAESRLDAAEAQLSELTGGGTVDVSFLMEGYAADTWHKADPIRKRDLLGLAIEHVSITRAPKQGCRFKGAERVTIAWASPEGDTDHYDQAA